MLLLLSIHVETGITRLRNSERHDYDIGLMLFGRRYQDSGPDGELN